MMKNNILLSIVFFCLFFSSAYADFDARWVEVPDSGYNPKCVPAVVYDSQNDRIVMLTGAVYTRDGDQDLSVYYSNEVLVFKDGKWTKLSASNDAYGIMQPRWDAQFCYDNSSGSVLVAGGYATKTLNDIFSLKGGSLSKLGNDVVLSDITGKGMFYNSYIEHPCLISGTGEIYSFIRNEYSEINNTLPNWGYRHVFGYSFNPSSNKLVLFGGCHEGVQYDNTFIYDAVNNSWKEVVCDVNPSKRDHPAMVYDPMRGSHVLFGGGSFDEGIMDDVWEFADTTETWEKLSIENPHSQTEHRIIYDSIHDKVYSIGGVIGSFETYATKIYELQFIQKNAVEHWGAYSEK